MMIFFIRVQDPFVRTLEQKLVKTTNVTRVEQVSVHGGPAKSERGFTAPGIEHTMLIVRVAGTSDKDLGPIGVRQLLDAAKTLDAIYGYESVQSVEVATPLSI